MLGTHKQPIIILRNTLVLHQKEGKKVGPKKG